MESGGDDETGRVTVGEDEMGVVSEGSVEGADKVEATGGGEAREALDVVDGVVEVIGVKD